MPLLEDLRYKAEWRYGGVSARTLLKALLSDGSFAMICYRGMAWAHRWHLAPLTMLLNKINAIFGQCIIGRGAQFGPGFVLEHSQGVVISGAVRGGSRIVLEHQVTIGAARGATPTLGDNIYVGAGAKILGAITVGSNVRIGANAVVVKDVPSGVTVGGIPARILRTHDGEASGETSPPS